MIRIKSLSRRRQAGAWVLLTLVILNMAMIFFFSSEDIDATIDRSNQITDAMVNAGDQRPTQSNPATPSNPTTDKEQKKASEDLQALVRKMAHFLEFMSLGLLSCALLLTVQMKPWWLSAAVACVFSLLYAISDEVHQLFVEGRAGTFRDVMIDFAGVLCGIVLVLATTWLARFVRRRRKERHAAQSV